MKSILHKSSSRGHVDMGWLKTFHSFSFSSYYDPSKIHFGALRVLNDDYVAAGKGFGMHPHDNMEIITILLKGALAHKDSMGNQETIQTNEIQVMSAGTGIMHSEFNPSATEACELLQIWVFPREKGVTPRYGQMKIQEKSNELQLIVSPNEADGAMWIHQDAWFHIGSFDKDSSYTYTLKKASNVVYAFVIEGSCNISGEFLERRDGIGISDTSNLNLELNAGCKLLLMDLPS